jgi:phage-related protein|nr:MAG TPA: tail protein [Caudoviricetes sp.]
MYTLIAENKYGEQLELTHNPRYDITDVDGLYPPEAVINSTKTASMDGAVFNSSYMNSRTITITLAINGPAEENRVNLYRYFKTKYPVRLYYQNGIRDVFIDGYVSKFSVEYFNQKQTAQIVVECPMPLFSATQESRIEFANVESLFEFPFAIEAEGIPFSDIATGKQKSIINGGDVETGVIIKLNSIGNVLNPKIYNVDTAEYMIINEEMQAGDEITINTRKKQKSITLLHDGLTSNIIGKLRAGSTWFNLVPGDNIFTYEADEFSDNLQCIFIINNQFEGV